MPPAEAGYVFLALADNTTALSWMKFVSRSRAPHLCNLSYLLSHLIFSFNSRQPCRFDESHIAGKHNVEADALSRPQLFPTYRDVHRDFPCLSPLRPCRIPRKLISLINGCLSTALMKETSNAAIEALLKVELPSLLLSSVPDWDSRTLLSAPSRTSTAREHSSPSR